MQRILNDPDHIVEEMLEGFLKSNPHIVAPTENPRVVRAVEPPQDRVGIVTGGGSGHKPAFVGYVGKNMVDAVAVGEIFSSPTAAAFLDAFRAANAGKGVACLYGNYSGDNMNVKMAARMAKKEGIEIKTVVANDDVPSASPAKFSCGKSAGQKRLPGLPWMRSLLRHRKRSTTPEALESA